MTKRNRIIVGVVGAGVLIVVVIVASITTLAPQRQSPTSILPIVIPIITQCNGSLTVVLYNGNLFVPVSYNLWVYGFNRSSGSATTDPKTYSGRLAAHEHRSFPDQLSCGAYKAAVMWNGGGSWHDRDATVTRDQPVEVDLSY